MHCSVVHSWKGLWGTTVLRTLNFTLLCFRIGTFLIKFNIRVVQLVFSSRQLTVTIGKQILWCLPDIVHDWITIEYVMFCKIWFVYLMFSYLSWCVPDSVLVCMWHFSNRKSNFYHTVGSFSVCLLSNFFDIYRVSFYRFFTEHRTSVETSFRGQ